MNNKEAIEVLKAIKEHPSMCVYLPAEYEALDLAIKALEERAIDCEVVEEIEKPYITKCREHAIKDNLPLYFIYYEEIGVFEVYVTATRELFEKRRCCEHLPNYAFNNMVHNYLEWYSEL